MTIEEKEGDVINGENDEVEIEYVVAAADERDEVVDEDDYEQEADDDDDDDAGESDDDDVHAGVHFSGSPVQSLDDEDDDDDGDEDDDEDDDDDDDDEDEEDDGEEVCSSSTSTTPTSKYSIHKAKMEENNGISKRSRDDAEGVQKANKKRKGKGLVLEDIVSNIGEQFKVYNEIRQYEMIIKKEKLVIERQKEIRKRRQLELEERNLKIQERKLELDERNLEIQERIVQTEIHTHKFDMLQVLLSKTSLTPSEEMFKEKLIMELYH